MASKKKRAAPTKTPSKRESVSDQSAFVVRHGGYPFDVLVCVGLTGEQVVAKLREYDDCEPTHDDIKRLTDPEDVARIGRTIWLDGCQTVLQLNEWRGSITHLGHLAHEVFHAVSMLFEKLGMVLSGDSDEAYAFAIEQLTVKILRQIALPPSKRVDE